MADDIFGDVSLFSEFERDREAQNIFIHFDEDECGIENRSRIIFRATESDSDLSDDENGIDAVQPKVGEESQSGQNNGTNASNSGETTPAGGDQEVEYSEVYEQGQTSASQKTSYQEQFEKNKYLQFARLIDSTRYVSDEESPGVQVVFQNNMFAQKYRSQIEQFIIGLVHHADKKDFAKSATDLSSKPTAVVTCVDINKKLPPEKRNTRMWQAHGIIGCAQFHNSFMVDSRGWPHDADAPSGLANGEPPKYVQTFDEIYPADDKAPNVKVPAKPKDACFNCGGEHRLNECKTPRDHNRIRAKRRERQEKVSNSKPSNPNRYHEDKELDPQKVKFHAGVISDSLREAMGLKSDQLPSYIYRMRLFGYPPGWLMEANRQVSSLAMYDKDGHDSNLRGENLEDGECGDQTPTEPAEAFDLTKIIEYPGFTVPVPPGFTDESDSIGMPRIQQHQLKKTLIEDMPTKETAKKRPLEKEEEEKNKKQKTKAGKEDVENEEDTPAVETSSLSEAEKKETSDKEENSEEASSPTLDSLQQEYRKLVQQLDSESDASLATGSTSESAATFSDSKSEADLLREKNFSFTSSASISKDFGTPILIREGSFRALPSAEKFGQGIEDHIPYENLPDSVGTFDKMKNLFSIIRDKVKRRKK